MSKLATFKSQLAAIVSNNELTQSEFEFEMLTLAEEIIQKIYAQTESYSHEEALCEIAKTSIQQIKMLIEPPF